MEEQNALIKIKDIHDPNRLPTNGNGNHNGYQRYWDAEGTEENHFKEYLRSVRKHLWLVIGITLVITSLVAIYEIRQPDIFAAHARVQVDLENNPAMGAAKNGTVVINSPTSDPTYFNTQLQNLSSQGLLRRVVKTLDLEHNQTFLKPSATQRSTWQSMLHVVGMDDKEQRNPVDHQLRLTKLAPATPSEDLAEAERLEPYVNRLQINLKIEPVKETRSGSSTRDTRLIDRHWR